MAEVPDQGLGRLSCGAAAKGPRWYHWACRPISSPDPDQYARWLVIQRGKADPMEVAYFAYGRPPATALADLVKTAGKRRAVEECLEPAKGACGPDEYEVRSLDRVAPNASNGRNR